MAVIDYLKGIFGVETKANTGNFRPQEEVNTGPVNLNPESTGTFYQVSDSKAIFKAFIPWFLYKPPYGFPREVNPLQLRLFAKNPYIFSVVKTISDEVASVPYDIVLKEEYINEGAKEDDTEKKQILMFFDNPNGNDESFDYLLRSWVRDVCEIGNFVGVKVFNMKGEFCQLFARDAATFLLNPDIHGYLGDRAEFVPPPTQYILTGGIPTNLQQQIAGAKSPADVDKAHEQIRSEHYDATYRDQAAYFQYGWTAGARPVPFGKREIIWGGISPRTDSIYHRSPIEIIYNQILTLVYGSEYNLDFYLNNNLPNGFLTIKGANPQQAQSYREQMQAQFMQDDEYGNNKKKHFKVPFTSYETQFTQMQLSSKEMEVIEQQKWFTRLVWSVFGVTGDEMGFIEDSNKAISENQSNVSKRKAIKPFLKMFEYLINNQLMPEFGHPEYEFKFVEYDIQEDKLKHDLWEQQIRMGVRTAKQVATEELGISEEDFSQVEEEKEKEENENEEGENGWWTKAEKVSDLERDLKKKLKELENKILNEIELEQTGLAEIKGFIDYKAISNRTLEKYKQFFNQQEYKQKISDKFKKEFQKGIEQIEKQLNRNILVSTSKLEEVIDFAFNNINDMSEELINKLRKEITMSLMNNEPLTKLKERVKKQFDLSKIRTETIVRTEIQRIFGTGSFEAAKQSGIDFNKYVSIHKDDRTSKTCLELDRKYGTKQQAIPIDEHFKTSEGEFLHEPFHVNCRSVTLFTPKESKKKE